MIEISFATRQGTILNRYEIAWIDSEFLRYIRGDKCVTI